MPTLSSRIFAIVWVWNRSIKISSQQKDHNWKNSPPERNTLKQDMRVCRAHSSLLEMSLNHSNAKFAALHTLSGFAFGCFIFILSSSWVDYIQTKNVIVMNKRRKQYEGEKKHEQREIRTKQRSNIPAHKKKIQTDASRHSEKSKNTHSHT